MEEKKTITLTEDNPLYHFNYCPRCGSGRFEAVARNARHCDNCGLTYYTNPRGATAALIVNEYDEMLVGIRANNPARGSYDLVGGFADNDETIEQTMCREIKEESGLEVAEHQLRYLFSQPNTYPFSGICVKTIDFFFEVRVEGRPELRGRDDIEQLRWVALKEIDPNDFGLESVSRGVRRYLEKR